jgi:hypothetical protein
MVSARSSGFGNDRVYAFWLYGKQVKPSQATGAPTEETIPLVSDKKDQEKDENKEKTLLIKRQDF